MTIECKTTTKILFQAPRETVEEVSPVTTVVMHKGFEGSKTMLTVYTPDVISIRFYDKYGILRSERPFQGEEINNFLPFLSMFPSIHFSSLFVRRQRIYSWKPTTENL